MAAVRSQLVGRAAGFLKSRVGAVFAGACLAGLVLAVTPLRKEPPPPIASPGEAFYKAGDYQRAADALRAAYRAAPSEQLKLEWARALFAAGDFAAVLNLLAEEGAAAAQQTDESGSAAKVLRAEALARLGRYEEARAAAPPPTGVYAGRAELIAARAYYAQGARGLAEEHLASALRVGGEAEGEAWLLRARFALDADDAATALAAARRAEEAGTPALAMVSIEAAIREGRFEDAARALAQFAKGGVGDRRARLDPRRDYLGMLLAAAEGDAAGAARRARAIEPWLMGEPNGRALLGAVRALAGDDSQALTILRRAATATPDNALVLDLLAGRLLESGRFEEADAAASRLSGVAPPAGRLRALEIALAQDAHDDAFEIAAASSTEEEAVSPMAVLFGGLSAPAREAAASRAYAAALLEAGGGASLESALAPFRDRPVAAMLAGEAALAGGDVPAARAHFERAALNAPEFWAPAAALARLDAAAGDGRAADARLETFVARRPDLLAARLELARLREAAGETKKAASILAPAAGDLTGNPDAAVYYAGLLARAGEGPALQSFADRLRRAQPASPATALVLGLAGRQQEAAVSARLALLASPGDPARLGAYRAAMTAAGREVEAAALLKALARDAALTQATENDGS